MASEAVRVPPRLLGATTVHLEAVIMECNTHIKAIAGLPEDSAWVHDDLSLLFGSHKVARENWFKELSCDFHTHAVVWAHLGSHTPIHPKVITPGKMFHHVQYSTCGQAPKRLIITQSMLILVSLLCHWWVFRTKASRGLLCHSLGPQASLVKSRNIGIGQAGKKSDSQL